MAQNRITSRCARALHVSVSNAAFLLALGGCGVLVWLVAGVAGPVVAAVMGVAVLLVLSRLWWMRQPVVIPTMTQTPQAAGSLRVVAISDTHCTHQRLRVPPGDVLVHAGDFTKRGTIRVRLHLWRGSSMWRGWQCRH